MTREEFEGWYVDYRSRALRRLRRENDSLTDSEADDAFQTICERLWRLLGDRLAEITPALLTSFTFGKRRGQRRRGQLEWEALTMERQWARRRRNTVALIETFGLTGRRTPAAPGSDAGGGRFGQTDGDNDLILSALDRGLSDESGLAHEIESAPDVDDEHYRPFAHQLGWDDLASEDTALEELALLALVAAAPPDIATVLVARLGGATWDDVAEELGVLRQTVIYRVRSYVRGAIRGPLVSRAPYVPRRSKPPEHCHHCGQPCRLEPARVVCLICARQRDDKTATPAEQALQRRIDRDLMRQAMRFYTPLPKDRRQKPAPPFDPADSIVPGPVTITRPSGSTSTVRYAEMIARRRHAPLPGDPRFRRSPFAKVA